MEVSGGIKRLNLKPQYTDLDWDAVERYYINSLANLNVPTELNLAVIDNFNHKLDLLKTEATMELAMVERAYEIYSNAVKNSEKEIFVIVKTEQLKNNNKTKLTAADIDGLTVKRIKDTNYENTKFNLYQIRDKAFSRFCFMKRVVECLKDKQQALITINTLFSIDNKYTNCYNPGSKKR